MTQNGRPIVFISCGQRTREEKHLGQAICRLVEELTPFKPYFAEAQTTVEGLTTNISKALYDAAGFIVVMHKRGRVSYDTDGKPLLTRASVSGPPRTGIAHMDCARFPALAKSA